MRAESHMNNYFGVQMLGNDMNQLGASGALLNLLLRCLQNINFLTFYNFSFSGLS